MPHIILYDDEGNIIGFLPDDPDVGGGGGGGLVAQTTPAQVFGPHGIIVPPEDHPARPMYIDLKLIAKRVAKMLDKK